MLRNKIKAICDFRGITPDMLAANTGLSIQRVNSILAQEATIPFKYIACVCAYIGVQIDFLFCYGDL